ncbi:hypothetical protein [Candidatus Electronema sp. TJ]
MQRNIKPILLAELIGTAVAPCAPGSAGRQINLRNLLLQAEARSSA